VTEEAVRRTADALRAVGFMDNIVLLLPAMRGFVSLVGRECELFCKHDPWEGRIFEKRLISVPQYTYWAPSLDSDSIARFRAILAGTSMSATQVPPPTPTGRLNSQQPFPPSPPRWELS